MYRETEKENMLLSLKKSIGLKRNTIEGGRTRKKKKKRDDKFEDNIREKKSEKENHKKGKKDRCLYEYKYINIYSEREQKWKKNGKERWR